MHRPGRHAAPRAHRRIWPSVVAWSVEVATYSRHPLLLPSSSPGTGTGTGTGTGLMHPGDREGRGACGCGRWRWCGCECGCGCSVGSTRLLSMLQAKSPSADRAIASCTLRGARQVGTRENELECSNSSGGGGGGGVGGVDGSGQAGWCIRAHGSAGPSIHPCLATPINYDPAMILHPEQVRTRSFGGFWPSARGSSRRPGSVGAARWGVVERARHWTMMEWESLALRLCCAVSCRVVLCYSFGHEVVQLTPLVRCLAQDGKNGNITNTAAQCYAG